MGISDSFSVLRYNYASPNPDDAYVLTNLNSDKAEIQLYDLKLNKPIKLYLQITTTIRYGNIS